MYDIGDSDLANSYDPKKSGKKFAKVPRIPNVDCKVNGLLKRVKQDKYPKAGKVYQFRFTVTRSNIDSVVVGGTYQFEFFPGNTSAEVDCDMFWSNITPILMAVKGERDIGKFNAFEALGELKSICDADENIELDLPFTVIRKMEEARKQKDGTYKANHLEADGKTPKWFPRDELHPGTV